MIRIRRKSLRMALLTFSKIYAALPVAGINRPVFIVGCGRSGTTILGRALSYHPEITYLNEPRHLWFSCYPETDIWTDKADSRSGKLVLTAEDEDPIKTQKLSRMFRYATIMTGKPVLVEKLPINSFRLPFIHKLFPDARFVHILRNGIEVGKSIEKESKEGWFGSNDYKWNILVAHASSQEGTMHIPELCSNAYERGLLEWRLSTEAVHHFFQTVPANLCCQITYGELVADPVTVINRVLSFLALDKSPSVDDFARNNVAGQPEKKTAKQLTAKEKFIIGAMLSRTLLI